MIFPEGQLWEGKRRRVLRTMSKNYFLSLILRGSAAKNWFWMPTGARIQRFLAANENFQKIDLNIFALGQRLSEGIRGFGDCSGEFEIYLKMHLKVICRSLQIHRTMIPKTSTIPKFLKILWFSPTGSSEKENEGECFAPCQRIILYLWFCAAAQRKIHFECPPGLEFKGFWPRMKIFKNLISTFLLWDKDF